VIEHKKVVKERKFENNFQDFPEVNHQLVSRGWHMLINLIGEGNDRLSREFYAHANRAKDSDPYPSTCVVHGAQVDNSARALNQFLGLPHVENCVVRMRRRFWDASNASDMDEMKNHRCLPGTTWFCGQTTTQRVRLQRLNPEARVWVEFLVRNLEPSGNSSEVTVIQMILIDAICAGEAVDLGLILRDSLQMVADKKAS
jgi:hypothetical protein